MNTELHHWLGAMVIIIVGILAVDVARNWWASPETEKATQVPLPIITHETNRIIHGFTGNTITFIVAADRSTAVERW